MVPNHKRNLCFFAVSLLIAVVTCIPVSVSTNDEILSARRSKRRKILNGSRDGDAEKKAKDQPSWFVSVGTFFVDDDKHSICGGFLISPEYVLTSARCVTQKPFHSKQADLESVSLTLLKICPEMDPRKCRGNKFMSLLPDRITMHPEYDPAVYGKNDLALIRLDERLVDLDPVGIEITPMKIDDGSLVDSYLINRANLKVIGYDKNTMKLNYESCDAELSQGQIMRNTDYIDCSMGRYEGGMLYDERTGMMVGISVVGTRHFRWDNKVPKQYAKLTTKFGWIRNTICNGQMHNASLPDLCFVEVSPPSVGVIRSEDKRPLINHSQQKANEIIVRSRASEAD